MPCTLGHFTGIRPCSCCHAGTKLSDREREVRQGQGRNGSMQLLRMGPPHSFSLVRPPARLVCSAACQAHWACRCATQLPGLPCRWRCGASQPATASGCSGCVGKAQQRRSRSSLSRRSKVSSSRGRLVIKLWLEKRRQSRTAWLVLAWKLESNHLMQLYMSVSALREASR